MEKNKISLEYFEKEFYNTPGLQLEYESLYHYLLYVCGGDFTMYDDEDRTFAIIMDHNLRFTDPVI